MKKKKLKICLFFVVVSLILSCKNNKKSIPKIKYDISKETINISSQDDSFQNLLNSVSIEKYKDESVSKIGIFSIVNLFDNEAIIDNFESYLSNQEKDIYIGIYTLLEPQTEFVRIDDNEQLFYKYYTMVNIDENRRMLITFWKYNPKYNNKFEYIFENKNKRIKILMEKKDAASYAITRS